MDKLKEESEKHLGSIISQSSKILANRLERRMLETAMNSEDGLFEFDWRADEDHQIEVNVAVVEAAIADLKKKYGITYHKIKPFKMYGPLGCLSPDPEDWIKIIIRVGEGDDKKSCLIL